MSGQTPFPIAATKLTAPALPPDLVNRPRLNALLGVVDLPALCLVVAPAGWGKSVAVAAWLASTGRDAAWCRFDEADRSVLRFWRLVCAALDRVLPGSVPESTALAGVANVDVERHLIPTMVNEIVAAGREVRLVLDDLDRAATPDAMSSLSKFVESRPGNLSVVALSRQPLGIARGRLAMDGSLIEIDRGHLAFEPAEAAAFGSGGDPLAADELVERTGGWAAGLILETRLGRQPARGDLLSDYLEHELVGEGDDVLWSFLTEVSLLDAVTPRAASVICPGIDVARLCDRAQRLGVLEAAGTQPPEWRFVPIFRDFFRARLAATTSTSAIARLQLGAADALAGVGQYVEALDLIANAVAADPSGAETLLSRIWLDALNHGAFDQVEEVVTRLASRDADLHPPLAMAAAWAALNRGRLDGAQLWNERVRAGLNGVDTYPELDGGPSMLDAHLLRHLGRLASALNAATDAYHSFAPLGDSPGYAGACTVLGQNRLWAGAPDATGPLTEGLRVGETTGEHVSVIACAGHLALAAAIDGRRPDTVVNASRAISFAEAKGLSEYHHTAVAHLALGLVDASAGLLDQAELKLELAVTLADRGCEPYERILAQLTLVDLSLRSGNPKEASLRLDNIDTELAALQPSPLLEAVHVRIHAHHQSAHPSNPENRNLVDPLTARELSVLRLLRSPLTQREIANELFISFNTSRTHTKAIYRKLGATSRAEAVAIAEAAELL